MKPLLQVNLGLVGRVRVVESDGLFERSELRDMFRRKEARVVSLGRNLVVNQGLALTAYLLGFGRVPGMTIGGQAVSVLDLKISEMHFSSKTSPSTPSAADVALEQAAFYMDLGLSVNQGATNHTVKYSGVIPGGQFDGTVVTEAGMFIMIDPTGVAIRKMVARVLLDPFVKAGALTYTIDWDITVTATPS